MALADYQILVNSLVRDQGGTLSSADLDRAIELARLRYSADVGRELSQDVTWAQDGYFGPLPQGWVEGCWIVAAEYPIGRQPPELIELAIYHEPTAQHLVSTEALNAGSVVRVRFAAPHGLAGGANPVDTIPLVHREAVASYAASVLCRQLAAHFSAERESSIGADGSNTESRARNYALRARDYRAGYFAGIGKADPQADAGAGGAGASGAPAASVSAWAGRSRAGLRSNDVGGF